jgi:hypothetical protein
MAAPAPRNQQPASAPDKEPIYRVIQGLMLFDILLGLFLALFGEQIFALPGLRIAGIMLTLLGGALFLFFGRLAARARRDGGRSR